MSDHHDCVLTAVAAEQFLELLIGRAGAKRVVGDHFVFVIDLVGHHGSGLRSASQRAGDDDVDGDIEGRQRTSHIVGLLNSQLVQGPFLVFCGIEFRLTGVGVTQEDKSA